MSVRRFDPAPSILVETDQEGEPRWFSWRGRGERVVAVEATWDEQDGWWRGLGKATTRRCYRVWTGTGLRCLLYHAGAEAAWSLGAILD